MKLVVLTGRILFSLIFIMSGFTHFKDQTIQYAQSHGVIIPQVLVPLAGVMAIIGGISIAAGFKAKLGGWLIVAFLVPVTPAMHNFWTVDDPQQYQLQMIMFMKNISMLGGALLITYFGAGPWSIDQRKNMSEDSKQ